MKAWYLQRSEGSVGSPGSGVTDDCEPLFFNYGLLCWDRDSLCRPCCPMIHSVDQADLLGECFASLLGPACGVSSVWLLILDYSQAYSHSLLFRGPSWRSEGQMLTVAWILMSVRASHPFFSQTLWFLPTTKLHLQLNASFIVFLLNFSSY